jgi:hypothetical protein
MAWNSQVKRDHGAGGRVTRIERAAAAIVEWGE